VRLRARNPPETQSEHSNWRTSFRGHGRSGTADELWCTGIAWAIMAAESRAVIFFQHNMFLESRASGLLVARSLLGLAARVTGGVIEAPAAPRNATTTSSGDRGLLK